jgi:SH3 domain-containing protein
MPFCSKPLGAALSIAAIATVTLASPGHAQQDPGAAAGAAPQPPQAAPEVKPPDGPSPPPQRVARPRSPGSAVVSAKVNLRSGAGTDFEVITTIPAGSAVRVTGCDNEWCALTWNGQSGYAIARNLDLGVSRQARAYPAQPGPGYPEDYDRPGYGPGYYGPPAVYGPAYYYGPRVYYYGRPWGWRRHWW